MNLLHCYNSNVILQVNHARPKLKTAKEWKPHGRLTPPQGHSVDLIHKMWTLKHLPVKSKCPFTTDNIIWYIVPWVVRFSSSAGYEAGMCMFLKLLFRKWQKHWRMWTGEYFKCIFFFLMKHAMLVFVLLSGFIWSQTDFKTALHHTESCSNDKMPHHLFAYV